MAPNTKSYADIAAIIIPSNEFKKHVAASSSEVDEGSGVKVLTPSRSRLRFPSSWERVYHDYETEYLPMVWIFIRLLNNLCEKHTDKHQIFSDHFQSLFNKNEVTKATDPQLCNCRDGLFTFSETTVLSVFIIFEIRSPVTIEVKKRDGVATAMIGDELEPGVILITQGGCNLRFSGGGEMILANMTYKKG
ncbi:hypothetical protein BDV35DRAFT_145527 [Aspergillus flavus]|uniref:Uncharacterized protein n=1 Tax=Aspergillus flavus TaxID=5059 RepID=A0A5N6GCB9_ASPFL|nr:hypothetical protein BDV35DRAFT_145527 [Aspergillus flavus]GMG22201.1 unnamed protein product [Aspergillus oryzae]